MNDLDQLTNDFGLTAAAFQALENLAAVRVRNEKLEAQFRALGVSEVIQALRRGEDV